MRVCPKCNQLKSECDFYRRSDRTGKPQSYCKLCNHANVLERQKAFKIKCVEYKGGCCQICNYSKSINALEFHHINPQSKEFSIAHVRLTSWSKNEKKIKNELNKCILLCANCHREQHERA